MRNVLADASLSTEGRLPIISTTISFSELDISFKFLMLKLH